MSNERRAVIRRNILRGLYLVPLYSLPVLVALIGAAMKRLAWALEAGGERVGCAGIAACAALPNFEHVPPTEAQQRAEQQRILDSVGGW